MPKRYEYVNPPSLGVENPRPKVAAVGKKITDVIDHKLKGVTSNDAEYWGLAEVLTDDMCDIVLSMDLRKPMTFDEIAKKNQQFSKEKVQELLDELSYIGLLEYDYGYHYDHNGRTAPQSERRYILPLFVPGSAELLNIHELPPDGINQRLIDHPELASFFERMTFVPLAGITHMVPPGGAGVGMHVIPVEKSIEM